MGNLKQIRARIGSVTNTQKITRAMKMVSAAKLRKAQENIINLRPYAKEIFSIITDIASTQRVIHPLLSTGSQTKKLLLVVVTSDRGLCGGFNGNINRFTEKLINETKNEYEVLDCLFVGKKSLEYFKSRNIQGIDSIMNLAKEISYTMAADVAEKLMKSYIEGGYDEIKLIYNEFKTAISQELVCETLLPINFKSSRLSEDKESMFSKDLIFEPEPDKIINELLHKHFAVQVFRCLSESVAAEHAARMTAMENATSNADDMISKLTLTYNKIRQASITTELIEITSGAEALNG